MSDLDRTTASLPEIKNSNETINSILKNIASHIDTLADRVEDRLPWNIFWAAKAEHCKELASQAAIIAQKEKLSEHEAWLLQIILLSHDIGRFIETLKDEDTLREWVRHGILSSEYLNKNDLLDWLTDNDKNIVLNAVKFHSEREVELDDSSLSYRLCYILRDFDKLELQENPKFLEAEWILWQLEKHYWVKMSEEDKDKYINLIENLVQDPDYTIDENDKVAVRIKEVLSRWIDEESLKEFQWKNSTTIQNIKHSYASYMLNSISHIFDVSSTSVLEKMIQTPMFWKRLAFIKKRIDENTYTSILKTVSDYCFTKGITQVATDVLEILDQTDV